MRALNCKGCAEKFTRTTIETLTDHALGYGAKGMAWILIHEDGEVNSILQKYFTKEQWKALLTALDAENGDFILFCADKFATVCRTLCGLRLEVGDMLGLRRKDETESSISGSAAMWSRWEWVRSTWSMRPISSRVRSPTPVPASIRMRSPIKNDVVRQSLAIAPEQPSTRICM